MGSILGPPLRQSVLNANLVIEPSNADEPPAEGLGAPQPTKCSEIGDRVGEQCVGADLRDAQGRVIDLKTAAKTPTEIKSDYRFQVATYRQLLGEIVSGEARVDTLVKTKTAKLVQIGCTIDQSDVDSAEKPYPVVQRGIRGGFFTPNRSHYLRSRKCCGFRRECERQFSWRRRQRSAEQGAE